MVVSSEWRRRQDGIFLPELAAECGITILVLSRSCLLLLLLAVQITAEVTYKEVHCFGLSRANFLELMDVYPSEMQDLMDEAKSL